MSESKTTDHDGACHCGDVIFKIASTIEEITTCDCSLCVKKNARMIKVHESQFKLETSWDKLSLYRWNTGVAMHYFCRQCGIYTFHRKRAERDHFGINIFCLSNFDELLYPVRNTSGASMSVEPESSLGFVSVPP